MRNRKLKMLLIGAGFMGREHLSSIQNSATVEYTGIIDKNQAAAEKLAIEFGIKSFISIDDAIKHISADAVDVCVPTVFHIDVVREAAAHGLHVLCEKPLALTIETALEIKKIASESNIKIMVAQVLRFWPEYVYAVNTAKNGTYGKILAIDCKRLSSRPAWNSWMTKQEIGGGAVLDLQIHDIDFIYQMLGKPDSIDSIGRSFDGTVNSIHNKLIYSSGISVFNEASFAMPQSYPFRMYFQIEFEKAVMEMDFWRPKSEKLKIFPENGNSFTPALSGKNAYTEEIIYFAENILANKNFDLVPLDESIQVLEICLKSKEILEYNNKKNRSFK